MYIYICILDIPCVYICVYNIILYTICIYICIYILYTLYYILSIRKTRDWVGSKPTRITLNPQQP